VEAVQSGRRRKPNNSYAAISSPARTYSIAAEVGVQPFPISHVGRPHVYRSGVQQSKLPHVKQHLGAVAPPLMPAHEPTPWERLELVGRLLQPKRDETIVDLGCGDGRVCVYLAWRYGCTCVGYEIDDARIALALAAVNRNDLSHLVTIRKQDVRTVDLSGVDGVYVYLYPDLLAELAAKLSAVPRVVSYHHAIHGLDQRKLEDFYVRP